MHDIHSSSSSSAEVIVKSQSAIEKALSRVGLKFDTVSEIDKYKAHPTVPEHVDPLQWWNANSAEYPVLSRMAKRYLAIPASSAASERAWSMLGDIFTKKRNRLKPSTICKLLMLKHNQDIVFTT